MKRLHSIFTAMLLTASAGGATAATVEGTPIQRKIFQTGCAFECPTGVVFVRGVEFEYRSGFSEYKKDGGTLVCLGDERRVVQKASVPSILARVDACYVDYFALELGDILFPEQKCNEQQLDICLDYQGGEACYDKWCD